MATNVFLLSMPDAIGIYLALALCGLAIIFLTIHVQYRFACARGALTTLNREWENAEAQFTNLAEIAQQKIGRLENVPGGAISQEPGASIDSGIRNQVTAMSRSGAAARDIARTAGLNEADIDVILGMSRVEGRKN